MKNELKLFCDDAIYFFTGLKTALWSAPEDNLAELVRQWKNYFEKNAVFVAEFKAVNRAMKELETELVMKGELEWEE